MYAIMVMCGVANSSSFKFHCNFSTRSLVLLCRFRDNFNIASGIFNLYNYDNVITFLMLSSFAIVIYFLRLQIKYSLYKYLSLVFNNLIFYVGHVTTYIIILDTVIFNEFHYKCAYSRIYSKIDLSV